MANAPLPDYEMREGRVHALEGCDQLVNLFGLLPSEARLAWAIAQGCSLVEAAEDLGVTTRPSAIISKKIYAKTGERGRSEHIDQRDLDFA